MWNTGKGQLVGIRNRDVKWSLFRDSFRLRGFLMVREVWVSSSRSYCTIEFTLNLARICRYREKIMNSQGINWTISYQKESLDKYCIASVFSWRTSVNLPRVIARVIIQTISGNERKQIWDGIFCWDRNLFNTKLDGNGPINNR